ncbi:MAG: peptidoglycan/LPS O-acetylase OafA/YrhL [Planctomycetota bacterium]|jgi:peptidoglycan/LPS O-acetylase OafA/YrhL
MTDSDLKALNVDGSVHSSTNGVQPGTRRLLALDVLRFVAVFLVLVHHALPGWLRAVPVPHELSKAIARGGWLGVDLFFVLSGYLIAGLLFREYKLNQNIRFGRFLVRRGLKIYPAFYFLLAITVLTAWVTRGTVPRNWLSELLFMQSYFGGIWGHTWSLAIEEHFYLVLPLALFLLLKLKTSTRDTFAWIPRVCVGLCLAILALRCVNALTTEFSPLTHFKPTHIRADALIFGVLLSYLHNFRTKSFEDFCSRYYYCLVAGGLWLWLPAFLGDLKTTPFLYSLGFTQFYIGSGMLVSAFVVRGIRANRFTKTLATIGTFSYSIYLWHWPVKVWGVQWLRSLEVEWLTNGLVFTLYLASSVLVGVLMAKLVEFPVLRFRDRFFPRRVASPKKDALREYEVPLAGNPILVPVPAPSVPLDSAPSETFSTEPGVGDEPVVVEVPTAPV